MYRLISINLLAFALMVIMSCLTKDEKPKEEDNNDSIPDTCVFKQPIKDPEITVTPLSPFSLEISWTEGEYEDSVSNVIFLKDEIQMSTNAESKIIDSMLDPRSYHCYELNILDTNECSLFKGSECNFTMDYLLPKGPDSIWAEGVSNSEIKISWHPVMDSNIVGYKVFRSDTVEVLVGSTTDTFFVDSGYPPLWTECYAVKSYDKLDSIAYIQEPQNGCASTLSSIGNGIPKFINHHYIELSKIQKISKFRSGIGHDYSDSFEDCRSMKHYYLPLDTIDWKTVKIYSPVSGIVTHNPNPVLGGERIEIKPHDYADMSIILFHVTLISPLDIGDSVEAGQEIGHHFSSSTFSDIAVFVHAPEGKHRYISYFETLTDSIFADYEQYGITSRSDVQIIETDRDKDPLGCAIKGSGFDTTGTLENFVILQ